MFYEIKKNKFNLLILYICLCIFPYLYPFVLVALALAWLWNSKHLMYPNSIAEVNVCFLFIWFGVIILFGVTALQTKTRT